MHDSQVTIDLSFAKSPLAVRQTIGLAIGLAIDKEITWRNLRDYLCDPASSRVPKYLLFRGLSNLALTVPDEEKMLRQIIRAMEVFRPDVTVRIVLHD